MNSKLLIISKVFFMAILLNLSYTDLSTSNRVFMKLCFWLYYDWSPSFISKHAYGNNYGW